MKKLAGNMHAIAAIAIFALVVALVGAACVTQSPYGARASSSTQNSQSKSSNVKSGDKAEAGPVVAEDSSGGDWLIRGVVSSVSCFLPNGDRLFDQAAYDSIHPLEWSDVAMNILQDDGSSVGGWWQVANSATERFVLVGNSGYVVYGHDGSGQYGYSVVAEGGIESMDPVFEPIANNPFGNTDADETTFTCSDGTTLVWREADLDTLELEKARSPESVFTGNLVRSGLGHSLPDDLQMFWARQSEWKYPSYPLDEIADMNTVDGLQVLTGTIKVAPEQYFFAQYRGFGSYDPSEPADDSEKIAVLVLDSPTFAEGEHASTPGGWMIRPIQTVNLFGGAADWLSLDGVRTTIAVNSENVLFPSDVQPCDAKAFDAQLW